MTYRQITSEERYILATLRKQGFNSSEIARALNNRPRKRLGFKTPQECFNEI